MKTIHAIVINPQDNVATLCEDGKQGDFIRVEQQNIELLQDSGQGHKIALTALNAGTKIMKYNSVMGTCTQATRAGEWVHSHNLESDYMKNGGEGEAHE